MNDAVLREVYRRIVAGEDEHGAFLTGFAKAVGLADYENFRLLRPLAMVLAGKYKLVPCAASISLENCALEQVAVTLALKQEARGVVLVLLHQHERIEIVAGLREEVPALAELLQKIADRVKDGDGMPVGGHLHTIVQP
jgi:hypothetical protein